MERLTVEQGIRFESVVKADMVFVNPFEKEEK